MLCLESGSPQISVGDLPAKTLKGASEMRSDDDDTFTHIGQCHVDQIKRNKYVDSQPIMQYLCCSIKRRKDVKEYPKVKENALL